MKRLINFLLTIIACLSLSSCDTMLQAMQNVAAASYGGLYDTSSSYNTTSSGVNLSNVAVYPTATSSSTTSNTTQQRKWKNCHACLGSGKCKHCEGTGVNKKLKRQCGVCHGTIRCSGCNGKGGFYYY